jgi:copper chaperone CopZ
MVTLISHCERKPVTSEAATANTIAIPVSGMHCAGCSSRVQRALEQAPGVSSANVNLVTGSATVDFDPSSTSAERLVEVIRGTGYGAELPEPEAAGDEIDVRENARAEEIRELRRKFTVSIIAVGANGFSGIAALARLKPIVPAMARAGVPADYSGQLALAAGFFLPLAVATLVLGQLAHP